MTFPGHSRGHDGHLFPMQHGAGVLVTCGLIPQHLLRNQDVVLAKFQAGQQCFIEATDEKSSIAQSLCPVDGNGTHISHQGRQHAVLCLFLPLKEIEWVGSLFSLLTPSHSAALLYA